VDIQRCKIFINWGKGNKDRYILFPKSFRLVLRSHLKGNPKNRYLFESHGEQFPLTITQGHSSMIVPSKLAKISTLPVAVGKTALATIKAWILNLLVRRPTPSPFR
jgi:hypothetical protein